jgi:hypothetical protein
VLERLSNRLGQEHGQGVPEALRELREEDVPGAGLRLQKPESEQRQNVPAVRQQVQPVKINYLDLHLA